jgi:hypothetical protein
VVKNHDKVLSAELDMVNDYKKMYEDYNWPQQTMNEPERTSIMIFGAKNGENVLTAANYKLMVKAQRHALTFQNNTFDKFCLKPGPKDFNCSFGTSYHYFDLSLAAFGGIPDDNITDALLESTISYLWSVAPTNVAPFMDPNFPTT